MPNILELDQQLTLSLNGSDSLFMDNLMSTVTSTASWTLLLMVLIYIFFKNNSIKEAFLIIGIIGLMIFVADRLCSGLAKPFVARWRPTQNPEIMYLVDTVNGYRGGKYGFFSGHASNTFCVAMFLSWLFRAPRMTVACFFWCTTTTFTRIYLGVHYMGDVVVGAIVGCILGFLFYLLYNHLRANLGTNRLISEQFTPAGYLQSDVDLFLTVMAGNYILLLIVALIRGL